MFATLHDQDTPKMVAPVVFAAVDVVTETALPLVLKAAVPDADPRVPTTMIVEAPAARTIAVLTTSAEPEVPEAVPLLRAVVATTGSEMVPVVPKWNLTVNTAAVVVPVATVANAANRSPDPTTKAFAGTAAPTK